MTPNPAELRKLARTFLGLEGLGVYRYALRQRLFDGRFAVFQRVGWDEDRDFWEPCTKWFTSIDRALEEFGLRIYLELRTRRLVRPRTADEREWRDEVAGE